MAIGTRDTRARSSATTELKRVVLMGALGRKFGRNHRFDIRNPAEAIRALCANKPGFEGELRESKNNNVGYRVIVGKDDLESVDEIHNPSGRQVIKIVPVVMGSGALGRILLGAALIAGAFFTGGATLTLGAGLVFGASTLFGVGAALVLGGVAQLIAGTPKSEKQQKPSYSFSGAQNITEQGHPVPVGYGRMIVGSVVVSSSLDTDDAPLENET